MSYNYIFNDIFRKIMKIGPLLSDSILIVDEAHNILNVCEETKERAIDYKNILNAINKIEKFNLKEKMKNNELSEIIIKRKQKYINIEEIKKIEDIILDYLKYLKECLLQLYEENENKFYGICCIIDKNILF